MNPSIRLYLPILLVAALLVGGCGGASASHTSLPGEPPGIDWLGPSKPVPGTQEHVVGSGPRGAVVLWGKGQKPSRDVVVFLHGFYLLAPGFYAGWIRHLVQRGSTVLYPAYAELGTEPADFLADAAAGIAAGLRFIRRPSRSLAIVGYSCGGAVALDYAAARGDGSSAPAAIATLDPTWHLPTGEVPPADLSRIPPSTNLLAIASGPRSSPKALEARRLLTRATQLPAARRRFRRFPVAGTNAVMRSDAAVRRALWRPVDRLIARARRSHG